MRICLFGILLFFILLSCNYYSQENEIGKLTFRLDSLLLKNEIEGFKSFYSIIDSNILKQKRDIFDFYLQIDKRLDRLNNVSKSKLIQYVNTYINQSNIFSLENAGTESHSAFNNFIKFLSANDTINAVKQVNVAISYRDRYIKEKKMTILGFYSKAEFYCDTDKPDSALIMIEKYYEAVNSFKPLSTIKDTLKIKSRSLNDKIQQKYFEFCQKQNPIMTDKFQISYSFSINTSQQLNRKYWPYIEYKGDKTLNSLTGGLNSFFGEDHNIALSYFFSPGISSVVEFNLGKLYYSSPAVMPDLVSNGKYSAINKSVNLIGEYFFSEHLGFRSYLGMGLGFSNYKLKIEKVLSYRYYPGYPNLFSIVNNDEKGYYTSSILFRFGVDYLLIEPKISLGIAANYMYMLKDIFFISQNVYKISLSIGYRF